MLQISICRNEDDEVSTGQLQEIFPGKMRVCIQEIFRRASILVELHEETQSEN